MKLAFPACAVALVLAGCDPNSPRMTGLYAVERDVLDVETAKLAACLTSRLTPDASQPALRMREAPDGSWYLFGHRDGETPVWEIRLTRVGKVRTEVEIDAAPLAFGAGAGDARLAGLLQDCAEGRKARRR